MGVEAMFPLRPYDDVRPISPRDGFVIGLVLGVVLVGVALFAWFQLRPYFIDYYEEGRVARHALGPGDNGRSCEAIWDATRYDFRGYWDFKRGCEGGPVEPVDEID
jgi:hypothetical protein